MARRKFVTPNVTSVECPWARSSRVRSNQFEFARFVNWKSGFKGDRIGEVDTPLLRMLRRGLLLILYTGPLTLETL